jgi:hypothetical protein
MMLAYVFWHWRFPTVEETAYERRIVEFQEALRTQRPRGFQYSVVLKVGLAPWVGRDEDVYEEWYVVENSAALDALNEAAVSGACKEPHNQVAKDAAGGAGGLYRLRAGEAGLTTARVALWFAKPAGMSYETLYGMLQAEVVRAPAGGSMWQRQMVLGPAPEFCWHSAQDYRLLEGFEYLDIPMKQIWVG